MGAYRYCHICDTAMDAPTARDELINGGQDCPIGHRNPQTKSLKEWVVDIDERLQELEKWQSTTLPQSLADG